MERIPIDSHCRLCSFGPQAPKINGEGEKNGLLVLGEAPHVSERATGRPFTGPSGRVIRTLLDKLGVPYYLSYAIRCQSQQNVTPFVITNCLSWTKVEIQEVQPKVIVALGATAALQLGFSGINEHRGQILEYEGVPVVVTWHPSAVFRDQNLLSQLWADLQLAKRLVLGENPNEEIPYRVLETPQELLNWLKDRSGPLALDIETQGLQWTLHEITSIQMSDGHEAVIFSPQLLKDPNVRDRLSQIPIVGHNLPYDLGFILYHYGLRLTPVGDSMLGAHMINENISKSLKQLVAAEFGVPDWSAKTREDYQNPSYAARDVYWTYRLVERVHSILEQRPAWTLYRKVIVPGISVVAQAHAHGVWVDLEALEKAEESIRAQKAVVEERLAQWAKINWRSPAQVARVLYQELGLPVVETTPQGGPSTKESALKNLKLITHHPLVDALLEYRRLDKAETAFLKPWRELIVNHRVYPKWNMTGTVTGRFSCTNPNLQQVPRDPLLRRVFSAPPGFTLIEADLSQAELRIAAVLAQEETMLSLLRSGQDIHAHTAKLLSGRDISEIPEDQRKEWRKKAKAVNFGFLYGMGARKFRETALEKFEMVVSEAEAERFRELFFGSYPRLREWHRKVINTLRRQGYVENMVGRRRTPIGSRDEAEREAINFVVQSLAADIILTAAVNLTQGVVVGFIHDALLIEVPEDEADHVEREVVELLTDPPIFRELGIRDFEGVLEADVKRGPWGS